MNAESIERTLAESGASAAIALCREHIARVPSDADAHRHLSQLLSAHGEDVAAQRAAMRACELAPHDPRAWSDLGRVHARARDYALAEQCFREAVTIDPQHTDGWHNLGQTLVNAGRDDAAFGIFKQSLQLDASRAATWIALGELLLRRGQDSDALECFDRAAACEPRLARARSRLGEYFLERGRVAHAEALFRQAVALDQNHIDGWIGLGRALEDSGDRSVARRTYLQALQRRPGNGVALAHYIAMLSGDDDADQNRSRRHLERTQRALIHPETPDEAKSLLGYALAKHYDKRGEFASAAHAGAIANRAKRASQGSLNRARLCERIDTLIGHYDREFFASRRRFGIGNDQPVWIVGMPRSGTTLIEQMLAAHPDMHGAGELPDLAQLALRISRGLDDVARAALHLTETLSREYAHVYLRSLQAGAPRGVRRISDKSPLNFFHLAFAATLFPGARIVHCRRDPHDTALSIWLENFNSEQHYATDFDDLAFFMTQYQRLMTHWRQVLPVPMLDVQYEDVVNDLDGQARALLEFLGVAWDRRCLTFHRHSRVVQTPSRWQVRQPLYTSSVGRWRSYAALLPELTTRFGAISCNSHP